MLWYIIDGWNLIHKIPHIKHTPFPQKELIAIIKRYHLTGSKNNRVTIVFDGKINMDVIRSEQEYEVMFSDTKSADEVIRSLVSSSRIKRQIVVVSDDRQIIDHAKSLSANILKTKDFLVSKKKGKTQKGSKEISYTLQREITEELRKHWLKE